MSVQILKTLSVPAIAMVVSAIFTHHLLVPEIRKADDHVVDQWENFLDSSHLVPMDHFPVPVPDAGPVTAKPPADTTLSRENDSGDIWTRMRSRFNLPREMRPLVESRLDRFRKYPRHVEQLLHQGKPYLFYILGRVEERGLPTELALLPVIESAFDPYARSPAGAMGIWQFMPATARHVGLRRSGWYDGRRDIIDATEAALDYLTELHRRFDGDWLLALAAYNAGGGRVNKAIRYNRSRGEPVDFWNLPLPSETRDYVPKLIALGYVISDPERYNIRLPVIDNSRYFNIVDIGGQIDLHVAARLAETSVEELQRLNAGLNRPITPPAGTHRLIVPVAKKKVFLQRLAELPPDERIRAIRYRIRQGDTLSEIARSYQTTVASLRKANRLESNDIFAGKLLIIPAPDQDEDSSDATHTAMMHAG